MAEETIDTPDANDLMVLTTVPVAALGQPLSDFLGHSGIACFVADDDTGLDATQPVEVKVAYKDLARAQSLLADFWAENDGPKDAM
ncbi:MAG: hypothetical protein U1F43_08430 [Myxococcota bacterium]